MAPKNGARRRKPPAARVRKPVIDAVAVQPGGRSFAVFMSTGRSYEIWLEDLVQGGDATAIGGEIRDFGDAVTVLLTGGRRISLPWDQVLAIADPEYEDLRETIAHADQTRIAAHVASRVRALRGEHNLTLPGLERAAGVKASTLSRIESGKYAPSLGVLEKVARALMVPVARFYAD